MQDVLALPALGASIWSRGVRSACTPGWKVPWHLGGATDPVPVDPEYCGSL